MLHFYVGAWNSNQYFANALFSTYLSLFLSVFALVSHFRTKTEEALRRTFEAREDEGEGADG